MTAYEFPIFQNSFLTRKIVSELTSIDNELYEIKYSVFNYSLLINGAFN